MSFLVFFSNLCSFIVVGFYGRILIFWFFVLCRIFENLFIMCSVLLVFVVRSWYCWEVICNFWLMFLEESCWIINFIVVWIWFKMVVIIKLENCLLYGLIRFIYGLDYFICWVYLGCEIIGVSKVFEYVLCFVYILFLEKLFR